MQTAALNPPASPEVRAHIEMQREREFEAVNAEFKQKWWRKLGAKVLGVLGSSPEQTSFEWERLKTDQVTEASERLEGIMQNTFEYKYRDNDLYFQGEALRPIFERGIRATEEIVKSQPQFGVELLRRHIEFKQLEEQIALAREPYQDDSTILVHISPTPDVVLAGKADLNAYDMERKKIMVRITERTIDGVRVTSLSLDGNNRLGLQAIGDTIGLDIADDATSEDILAMTGRVKASQFAGDHPVDTLRNRYDEAMAMQYGGEWRAGRRDSDIVTTMQKILRFPSVVDRHVQEVMRIKQRYGESFRSTKEYETATYDFLAAIEQSYKTGVTVTRLSSAGAGARAAGTAFSKSDCPTGVATTAEQAMQQQGIGEKQLRHLHAGTCQACQVDTLVGECNICLSCEEIDNRGGDLMDVRRRALARLALDEASRVFLSANQTSAERNKASLSRAKIFSDEFVKDMFGPKTRLNFRVTVGDGIPEVVDQKGNVIVQDLRTYDSSNYVFAA